MVADKRKAVVASSLDESSLAFVGNIMTGAEVGNYAHSVFLWDKLLKPYQKSSSFFSEFAAVKPLQQVLQERKPQAAKIDVTQVHLVSCFDFTVEAAMYLLAEYL